MLSGIAKTANATGAKMPTDKQSAERARAEKFVESKLTRMVRFPDDVAGWLNEFAALAVEREREECAKLVCDLCRAGDKVQRYVNKDLGLKAWLHSNEGECDAAAIWARDAERG